MREHLPFVISFSILCIACALAGVAATFLTITGPVL
jgi:hypothetical protein